MAGLLTMKNIAEGLLTTKLIPLPPSNIFNTLQIINSITAGCPSFTHDAKILPRKPENPASQNIPKRNGGLGALPRPSPVICWYWTKAIALPRVPGRLHIGIVASSRPLVWRYPLRRAPRRLHESRKWKITILRIG